MNKLGKVILIILGVLAAWLAFYLVAVPQILASDFIRTRVETIISHKTGFNLTLKNYRFRTDLTPTIRFKAESVTLESPDKNNLLQLKNIHTKINWLGLLAGNVSIRKFESDEFNVQFRNDYSEKLVSPRIINLIKRIRLKNTKIHNIALDLQNQKLIENMKLYGNDITIAQFNPNKKIKLNSKFHLETANKTSEIRIKTDLKMPISPQNIQKSIVNISVKELNLAIFSNTIQKLNPEIEKIQGIFDLNVTKDIGETLNWNLLSHNLSIKFPNVEHPLTHSRPIEIKSHISISDKSIKINQLKILSELIKSSILGEIILEEKTPSLNLSISLDKSNVQEIIKLLPPKENLIPELNLLALKKHFLDGNVLAHFDITGNTARPLINGNILISDAYIIKPIKNAKKATIKLIFNRDKMKLEANVPTAAKERVWANGTFEMYDEKRANLSVKSTPNINLEIVQTILNPLQEIIKIDFGPLPAMHLLGSGNVDLYINGNVADPHIRGALNFNNAEVYFNDMPNLIIKNGGGTLTFNDTDTHFQTTSATLNGKPLNVEGSCTLQGAFNFTATSKDQNLTKLLNDIKGNTLLADLNNYLEQIEKIKGLGDLDLNIYGQLNNIREIEFNKNIFTRGQIDLKAVTLKHQNIPQEISNIFGTIALDNQDILMNLYALINKSKVTIEGKIKDSSANLLVKTKAFRILDGISTLPLNIQRNILTLINSNEILNLLPSIYTNFTAKYKGAIDKIQPENLELYGSIYSNTNSALQKSNYEFTNSTLKFTPIKLNTKDINLETDAIITNLFSEKPIISGKFNLKDFNLELINLATLKNIQLLNPLVSKIEKLSGQINLSSNIQNNNLNANFNLKNIKLQENKHIHEILSGKVSIRNNQVSTENINARFFDMPLLLNGKVLFHNKELPHYHFTLNSKPNQEVFNSCFNQNALYPIKVKGDLTLNAEIQGNTKNAHIKSNLLLAKDASIYYMGATLGDKSNSVKLTSNITLHNNNLKINHFNYDKLIPSLDNNETTVPLLHIDGAMTYSPDNVIGFNNLKIKSLMPVDAKIFNIIFRKPFMKEGFFTSDLVLNGSSIKPNVLGKLNITDINIPLVETNINNINLDFAPQTINMTSSGDLITNKIKLDATLKNDLSLPLQIENMKVHVSKLDLNKINEKFRHIEETNFKMHTTTNNALPLDYTNFIIHNSSILADTILIDNITATNFNSNVEIGQDKIMKVKNFNFDLAEGRVYGVATHNYNNNNATLNLILDRANAALIAETLFDITGQIYGLANGKMNLTCNAQNDKTCLASLSGDGNFTIQNGKMPKLGSLEYLLKAGNLLSNGLTGLTINGLIDLLSPLKSGEFKTIAGTFTLNEGTAEKINIYSSGKDLNLYITGKYNLSTAIADFQIFGSLSKNITTVFNKVKNLSLNTLLKTIPGIKNESTTEFATDIAKIPNSNDRNNIYKFFRAIINGDINGENFVKSFEWID